jgi:bifunctional non-homologous end joining protein LigD
MEPVALTEEGKSSFQALQAALSEHANSIIAYLFDILHLDGTDLTLQPLRARKKILQKLLNGSKSNVLRYSEHVKATGRELLAPACKAGLEEIVSKEAASPYRPGRQNSWLKSKCTLRREFVIVGYSGGRSGERALGALQLAYHKVKALQYAGKVGTGFTLRSAKELAARLQKLTRQTSPLDQEEMAKLTAKERNSAHWVTPKLLCEVEFTEATNDGQLRHPSFRGLREDKRQQGAGKEEPIAN